MGSTRFLLGNVTLSELDASGAVVGSIPLTLLGVDPSGQPVTVSGPSVGSGGNTASPGIVVLGNRAYLVQNSFTGGQLEAWDIDDPASPTQIPFDATATPGQSMDLASISQVAGRPVDVAGEANLDSPLGSRVVVVATASANESRPSNLDVFDVSDDSHPHWIGAASVTGSAADGTLVRVKVVDGKAYTVTSLKGLVFSRSTYVPEPSSPGLAWGRSLVVARAGQHRLLTNKAGENE